MFGEYDRARRRSRFCRWPRDGGAERAQPAGMARGLQSHRALWVVRDLRGVRDDCGFDGDATFEVAEDLPDGNFLAPAYSVAQLPAYLDLLAQRSQRLQPSGARLHRHDSYQAGNR